MLFLNAFQPVIYLLFYRNFQLNKINTIIPILQKEAGKYCVSTRREQRQIRSTVLSFPALLLSEDGHWVYCGASQCQVLFVTALDTLFRALSDPQLVVPSDWAGCIWEKGSCAASSAFSGPGPRGRSGKIQSTQRSTSHFRLIVSLSRLLNLSL